MTYTLNAPQIDTPLAQPDDHRKHVPHPRARGRQHTGALGPGDRLGAGTRLLGQAGRQQPRGDQGPPRACYMVERARDRGELRPGRAHRGVHQRDLRPGPGAGRHRPRPPGDAGDRPGHGAADAPAAVGLRSPGRASSPSRTRWAAGSRPAASACSELLGEHPDAYCPDQYNNPDNVTAYAGLAHGTGRPARADRRPGVQRGHRRPQRRRLPRAAALLSRPAAGRRRHDRLDHLRPARPPPADARPGQQHPSAQRRVRALQRGPLGRARRKRSGPAGAWPRCGTPPAAGASARSPWWPPGWPARCPATPGSRRSSPTARTATSTPSSTTTTAPRTACSARRRPTDPDEIDHPGEREVTRWTRCTTVVDPLAPAASLPGTAPQGAAR